MGAFKVQLSGEAGDVRIAYVRAVDEGEKPGGISDEFGREFRLVTEDLGGRK